MAPPHRTHSKRNTIKVTHANVDSFNLRKDELEVLSNEIKPDIITLNETKTHPHEPLDLPNYITACRHDISKHQGGVAILTRSGLQHSVIPTDAFTKMNTQVLAISTRVNNMDTAIVAYYNPPRAQPRQEIFDVILKSYKHALFIGDLNSKHLLFGCTTTNTSGDILFDIIETYDLTVLNSPEPTYYRGTYSQLLDLALATPRITNSCHPVTVGPDIGTNHQPITVTIDTTSAPYADRKTTKNYNKTDWSKFQHILTHDDPPTIDKQIITKEYIDRQVDAISDTIFRALNETTPSYPPKHRPSTFPTAIVNKIKLKRKMRRRLQKKWDPTLNNAINRLHKEIKSEIRKHQTEKWDTMVTKLNDKINSKDFWTLFKKISNSKHSKSAPPSIFNEENTLTSTDMETANVFARNLSKIHNPHDGPNFDDSFKESVDNSILKDQKLFNPNFEPNSQPPSEAHQTSPEEIKTTIAKIKNKNSAPGDDQLSYRTLKQLPCNIINYLSDLFNLILTTGYFPDAWKRATGVMIPKPNKDRKIALNYRPISLLRCLGKLLEKILAKRLLNHMNRKQLINKWQRAYLARKEANEHVFRLGTQLRHFRQLRWHTGILLFDVEKAFDSVWHNGIRYKLRGYQLPDYLIRILSSFLMDRQITVKINNNTSEKVTLNAGTPQGSVISPLLFILYVNDLPIHPNNKLEVSQYADDLALWTSAKSLDFVKIRLQRGIDDLLLWCSIWRIKLNNTKTQYLVTSDKETRLRITINQDEIKPDKTASLLGVTFDKQLTFSAHIDIISDKARKRLNLLRCLKGTEFGANHLVIMKTYKAYIRPILEIGYVVTSDASENQLRKLQVIQNQAIRIAYNLPRTTSIKILHETSELDPIRDRLSHLKTKAIARFGQHSLLNETKDLLDRNPHQTRS